MHQTHSIRSAIPEDRPALREIYAECRARAVWLAPEQRAEADLDRDAWGETIWVACDDTNRPVGFVSVWRPDAFVHHLYIRPDWQGLGLGRALLAEVAKHLAPPLRLKCVTANTAAVAFYQRLGWAVESTGVSENRAYLLMRWDWIDT
jgi:GNAT superfamily N-acetyltransferase